MARMEGLKARGAGEGLAASQRIGGLDCARRGVVGEARGCAPIMLWLPIKAFESTRRSSEKRSFAAEL